MFITIEGIEGSGKTTQVGLLREALERRGLAARVTREPGGTPAGEKIRALLLDPEARLGALAELFLVLADRAEHVASGIRPALDRGEIVLCDRFSDSTIAYQAFGRGLPLDVVERLEDVSRQGVRPDLTLLLDCPVDVGLARTKRRRTTAVADRFEGEEAAFHERVRAGFLDLARRFPDRIRVLDSTRARDEVHAAIVAESERRMAAA